MSTSERPESWDFFKSDKKLYLHGFFFFPDYNDLNNKYQGFLRVVYVQIIFKKHAAYDWNLTILQKTIKYFFRK